ncbi:MAG: hypothetical protein WB783_21090 [Arenicellales bacterium]
MLDHRRLRNNGHRGLVLAVLAVSAMGVSGCGGKDEKAAKEASKAVDACTLVTPAEIHGLSPRLGSGHHSKMKIPNKSVSICDFDDDKHIPALILTVTPAPSGGVKADLEQQLGGFGYAMSSVSGLGDEAAAAVQQPDPSKGIKAGLAFLASRAGQWEVTLSPVRLDIPDSSGAAFSRLKTVAAAAVTRLRAAGH